MTKLLITLIIVSALAASGLIATSESAYMDSKAGQAQFLSTVLK